MEQEARCYDPTSIGARSLELLMPFDMFASLVHPFSYFFLAIWLNGEWDMAFSREMHFNFESASVQTACGFCASQSLA
jgi:hypothetical protein